MYLNPLCKTDLKTAIMEFAGVEEPVFGSKSEFVGQPVGMILARSRQRALEIAHSATIEMANTEKFRTFDEAIEMESFHKPVKMHIECGESWSSIEKDEALVKIEGTVRTNPQFHAYTEPLCAIADYSDGCFDVQVTTQFPTGCQEAIAFALQEPQNRVSVSVKRIGGGFGGKGTKESGEEYLLPNKTKFCCSGLALVKKRNVRATESV